MIVYLLDLPSLANTNGEEISTHHSIWRTSATIQDLDRSIGSSLGNLDPHGPPMLAWMLSHYLVDNQVGKYKTLGERAFQLHVIEYLSSGLHCDALNANQVLSAINYGVAFGLVSILVTAFDPARMGIEDKLFQLLLVMVKKEVISSKFVFRLI